MTVTAPRLAPLEVMRLVRHALRAREAYHPEGGVA